MRRQAREEDADERGVPSPDGILAREETRRHVIEAVLGLEEPYRATILLLYYENLPPRRVAERLSVPLPTVKARRQRGLEKLRTRLDARYGGERRDSCLALVPLAGLHPGGTAFVSPSLAGVWTMLANTKAVALVAVLLVVAGITWRALGVEPAGAGGTELDPRALYAPELVAEVEGDPGAVLVPPAEASPEATRHAVGPDTMTLAVRVRDVGTGEPVPVFDLHLTQRSLTTFDLTTVFRGTVHDAEGRFAHPLPGDGRYRVDVRTSHHLPIWTPDFDVTEEEPPAEVLLDLDPGLAVRGRVVAHDDGRPLAGVVIASDGCTRGMEEHLFGFPEYDAHAVSDDDGYFLLGGLPQKQQSLAALHPEFAEALASLTPRRTAAELALDPPGTEEEVVLRLRPGFRIHGTARDDGGSLLAGVVIRANAGHTPVARTVLTDAQGRFVTPPVAPGRLQVSAGPPWNEPGRTANFTREVREVEVVDSDLELHFGPRDEHVTWTGVLRDIDGTPLAGARINLDAAPYPPSVTATQYCSATTLSDGRFEFRKLYPTSYRVKVWLAAHASRVDAAPEAFTAAGVHDRDLQLRGALIGGHLVDAATGEPVRSDTRARVIAMVVGSGTVRSYSAVVDEDGRFLLRGLPPDQYRLSVHIDGYPGVNVPLEVTADEVRDDLRVELEPGGELSLRLEGFAGLGLGNYRLNMDSPGVSSSTTNGKLEADGTELRSLTLREGAYSVEVVFDNWGTIATECSIIQGETTDVVLRPTDRSAGGLRAVTVEGSLTRRDGAPFPGAIVMLIPIEVPGANRGGMPTRGRVDTEGRFVVPGIRAGQWFVTVSFSDGTTHDFGEWVVPPDASDPFPLELLLHAGRVTGRFVDAATGQPFPPDEPTTWVYLFDIETEESVGDQNPGSTGSHFTLVGLPPGEYRGEVIARGFQNRAFGPIIVGEGEEVNVGDLPLERAGVLDLEVVDANGEGVLNVDLFGNGERLRPFQLQNLTPKSCRCYNLPFGTVTIRAKAEGFAAAEVDVLVEPGTTATATLTVHAD